MLRLFMHNKRDVYGFPLQYMFPKSSSAWDFFSEKETLVERWPAEKYTYRLINFYVFDYFGDSSSVVSLNHSGKRFAPEEGKFYEFPLRRWEDRYLSHTPPKPRGSMDKKEVWDHAFQAGERLNYTLVWYEDKDKYSKLYNYSEVKWPEKGTVLRVGFFLARIFSRNEETRPQGEVFRKLLEGVEVYDSSAQVFFVRVNENASSPGEFVQLSKRTINIHVCRDVEPQSWGLVVAAYPVGGEQGGLRYPIALYVSPVEDKETLLKYLSHVAWVYSLLYSMKKGNSLYETSFEEFAEILYRLSSEIIGYYSLKYPKYASFSIQRQDLTLDYFLGLFTMPMFLVNDSGRITRIGFKPHLRENLELLKTMSKRRSRSIPELRKKFLDRLKERILVL